MSDHHNLNRESGRSSLVAALLWVWVAVITATYLYPYRHIIEAAVAKVLS